MIGYVAEQNGELFPTINVQVLDHESNTHLISGVIDTGFTGDIMLPPRIIQMIKPYYDGDVMTELADGSTISTDAYIGNLLWHGTRKEIEIIEADGYLLIGMNLLRGSTVNIQTVAGGAVHINEIHQD